MNLYLVRHPKPDVGEGICYGATDLVALPEHLSLVTQYLQQTLPLNNIRIISSPLQRCSAVAEKLGVHYQTVPAIAEMNFGHWEGTHWDKLPPDELKAWRSDMQNFVPPQGESVSAFLKRVMDYINGELLEQPQDTLLLTHAGVIRCVLDHCGIAPLAKGVRLQLDYGGITHLRYTDNQWTVEQVNRID